MPVLRFQCRLPRDSGLAEDDVVNVLHFDTDQTIAEDADDIAGRIIAFYNAVEAYLSPIMTGAVNIKAYDLSVAEGSRFPVYETSGTFQPGNVPLPAECAFCITLHCENAGDLAVPVRHRRGRIYLGALSTSLAQGTLAGDVAVESAERTAILTAAENLARGPDAGDGRLAVYSPTRDEGRGPTSGGAAGGPGPLPAIDPQTLADSTFDVTRISVDDRLDTQRRRGAAATTRQYVTVT